MLPTDGQKQKIRQRKENSGPLALRLEEPYNIRNIQPSTLSFTHPAHAQACDSWVGSFDALRYVFIFYLGQLLFSYFQADKKSNEFKAADWLKFKESGGITYDVSFNILPCNGNTYDDTSVKLYRFTSAESA